MKIRLTIMTENDKPVEILGDNPEEMIKKAWDVLLTMISLMSENNDNAYVERVEVMRGDDDETDRCRCDERENGLPCETWNGEHACVNV